MPRMTLEQLRVFIAVVERQHVTRTAAALNLAQSAVSAAIALLEERHGAKLFHRVGPGIELTEAGTLSPGSAGSVGTRGGRGVGWALSAGHIGCAGQSDDRQLLAAASPGSVSSSVSWNRYTRRRRQHGAGCLAQRTTGLHSGRRYAGEGRQCTTTPQCHHEMIAMQSTMKRSS
jgi:hypothetical protein